MAELGNVMFFDCYVLAGLRLESGGSEVGREQVLQRSACERLNERIELVCNESESKETPY